ncbi:unnamed protein product [Ambrosiozyma monospora]|uniref:Unnamed protein product n=1 Tax=Ambrosiozyma monospora TaxID=43982 RepID=A0A9W6Z3G2_AMBMO|nr:unnamed protein product [Ambrosiozyma monospora]
MTFVKGEKVNYVSELQTKMTREFGYFHKCFGFQSIPSEVENYITGLKANNQVFKTQIPPLRISVAFPNMSVLDETVLSSKPFFYLGSYWALALAKRPSEVKHKYHVKLMIGRTIQKADLFREWRVDGVVSNMPKFVDIDNGNVNHLAQPKAYPSVQPPPQTVLEVLPAEQDIDFSSDTRTSFVDQRHEIYTYATFYSPFDSERAEVQVKNYTTRGFKDWTYKWVSWDVFDEQGRVKRGLETFKVSMVLGIV